MGENARVGGNDYKRGVDDAVAVVGHQLAQYHYHHYGSGHVVENGRKEERDESNAPQQSPLALGGDDAPDEVESPILVDHLNDGHCTHQEKQRGGSAAKVALHHLADGRSYILAHRPRHVTAGVDHE